ncbi:hypothetical protein [Thaumasiovibrio subtropicus]|uniref:hypothetical protein n=1 Tax=Thaumasiovibrio subtropicus TaxID=1891207 RepID=UPI001C849232|nr:hypothetical protein [Thaumasiovibrio subtropicus]
MCSAIPCLIFAGSEHQVKVSGDTYLGIPESYVMIEFNENRCSLTSSGNPERDHSFALTLTCGDKAQVLWQVNFADTVMDEPRFGLLWAGDLDGDNEIDIKMEVSAKYSCTQQAIYLSSSAVKDELVNLAVLEEEVCF